MARGFEQELALARFLLHLVHFESQLSLPLSLSLSLSLPVYVSLSPIRHKIDS